MRTKALPVPFSKEVVPLHAVESNHNNTSNTVLPAAIRDGDFLMLPKHDVKRFIGLELKTPKLDKIQKYLWLAGLPRCARPLHRQTLMGRIIHITENPNEHLVWLESRIFIKPLPEYLFDFEFWVENICPETDLYKCACGFILSYAWLVCYRSDLRIAKDLGLLPQAIQWPQWSAFIQDFFTRINPETFEHVHDRYKFGELRLTRLDTLYKLTNISLDNFVRGYMTLPTWYRAFFTRNFAWLLAVFFYITVILSALQVGLSTARLQESKPFQNASYGVSIASLIAVLCIVVTMFSIWLLLFCYHVLSTWTYHTRMSQARLKLLES
jgi:hypothetical protein